MYDRPRTIEQVLTRLSETPPRIAALTDGLAPAQLLSPPEPGEWPARDVLAHLRACADIWGKCIAEILSEDNPTIKAVNPGTWIKQTNYREQEFKPSLQAFAAQRAGLLAVLKPLAPENWSRTATVTGAGKPLTGRCTRMPSGWQTMNSRTSSRSNASPTRCAYRPPVEKTGGPCPEVPSADVQNLCVGEGLPVKQERFSKETGER